MTRGSTGSSLAKLLHQVTDANLYCRGTPSSRFFSVPYKRILDFFVSHFGCRSGKIVNR
jgi:hypothetical protein